MDRVEGFGPVRFAALKSVGIDGDRSGPASASQFWDKG